MQFPPAPSHNTPMENSRSILGKRGSDFETRPSMQGAAYDTSLTNPAAVNVAPGTHTQHYPPASGMMMNNAMRPPLPPSHPQAHNHTITSAPPSSGNHYMNPSMGLEFAKMKKEEAREGFKMRRRHELIQIGEMDRIKRRRKNDTSISEHQKYNRRLKMNQDSAAAARYAQEMYVVTLEKLVCKFEMDRNQLSMDLNTVKNEKMNLKRVLDGLQKECAEEDAPRGRMPEQILPCPPAAAVSPVSSTSFHQKAASKMATTRVPTAPVSVSVPQHSDFDTSHRAPPARPTVYIAPLSRAPSMASAASATDPLAEVMAEIPELSDITAGTTDTSTTIPNSSRQQAQGEVSEPFVKQNNDNLEKKNSKKMTDLYDPSFLMSLGLDRIDFSRDIIDMHPVA